MTWNRAFDLTMEIKHAYADHFGDEDLYSGDNWLRHWVDSLGNAFYSAIIDELIVKQYGDLALLHYGIPHDMDGTDFFQAYGGIFRECRSLVIDLRNETMVLTPFSKFRNLGECEECSVENVMRLIEHAKVVEFSEKLDGSMQSARMVGGRLVMSGSKGLDRSQSYRLNGGYGYVESHDNYIKMLADHPDWTFIFESIFENDPHVVVYDEEGLYLVGIRDSADGREFDYREVIGVAEAYGIPATALYDLSFDEALAFLERTSGKEHEGFVLNVDSFRVKMKSDDYVRINGWIFGLRHDDILLKAVLAGEIDDILPKLPKAYRDDVEARAGRIFEAIDRRRSTVESYYLALKDEGFDTRKDSMIWIERNVPSKYRTMVRMRYLGQDVDYGKGLTVSEVFGTTDE